MDEKKLSLMDSVRKWVPKVWFENHWEQDKIFLATAVFALSSLASGVVLWRVPKQGIRKAVRCYSIWVISAMMFATAYLGYWGVIGLRAWA
ncbi:MAG: hypothetical protein ABI167_11185 [Nitrosospira sp.]